MRACGGMLHAPVMPNKRRGIRERNASEQRSETKKKKPVLICRSWFIVPSAQRRFNEQSTLNKFDVTGPSVISANMGYKRTPIVQPWSVVT